MTSNSSCLFMRLLAVIVRPPPFSSLLLWLLQHLPFLPMCSVWLLAPMFYLPKPPRKMSVSVT